MKICVILPVYNHPDYLPALIQHLASLQLAIIVVDDGCDAQCRAVIQQVQQQYALQLLQHQHNQGKGQAVMTAISYAYQQGFSHALQLDVDGQHNWQDIPKFLATAQQHPQALIIGHPIFDDSVPKKRLYGRYATHIWVWINSLSFAIKDSMCGFRVYPVAPCYTLLQQCRLQPRMGFDSEILVRLHWQGVACINVPTQVTYPEHGVSHFDAWRDNLAISKMHARLFFGMLRRAPKLLWQRVKN